VAAGRSGGSRAGGARAAGRGVGPGRAGGKQEPMGSVSCGNLGYKTRIKDEVDRIFVGWNFFVFFLANLSKIQELLEML